MATTLSVTCPTCNATVSDDARACARCGADVAIWSNAGRTPLILPGNPALSADLFRSARGSAMRIAVGSAVGAAALLGVVFFLRDDEGPPPPAVALLAPQPRVLADSEIIKPLPPIPTGDAAVASAVDVSTPALIDVPAATSVATAAVERKADTPAPTPVAAPVAAPVTRSAAAPITARVASAPLAAAPPVSTATPVLRLAPLISDSMRTGELLQIRWTVQDKSTGRAVTAPIEFTSTNAAIATVDRSKGTVTARGPGRVQIIADGGAAGRFAVNLTVRTQPRLAVSTVPAETLQIGTEAARSVSVIAPPARVTAPAVSAPTAAPVRDAPRVDPLDADDVRTVVNRFVTQIRNGDTSNPGLVEFLADGAGHRVSLVSPPATISASASVVRVTFEVRLTKFDGGGRPVTRVAPVSMDVEKRGGEVAASDVSISPLRRP